MSRRSQPTFGRTIHYGVSLGPTHCLDVRGAMLVVGPTQGGKTSSIVVPAILRWDGPVVVTSVKRDVVATTRGWRSSLGRVQVLAPGDEQGLTWNPLENVTTLRQALRVARDLVVGPGGRGDAEFWNALAAKLLASLFVVGLEDGRGIADVARLLEERDFGEWARAARPSEASRLLQAFLTHDVKTLDGVVTTAETMMLPWRFSQPFADVTSVVDGPHTLYLCSPRTEQQHYEGLFRGTLRTVLEAQQRRFDEGSSRRLLLVLDEAATVAPLDDLDQLAATLSGLDVTLLTVVQDFAQLRARWGERASTIVNNHSTRVVMGGLADPAASTYLPELAATKDDQPWLLRRQPAGTAVVIEGRKALVRVRLRPWWRQRSLRKRGTAAQ